MRYLIKKDYHRNSNCAFSFRYDVKQLNCAFSFDKECWYNVKEIGDHVNKLVGISTCFMPRIKEKKPIPGHHWCSVRLGWRPNEKEGFIDLFVYYYQEGKRTIDFLSTVKCENLYQFELELFDIMFLAKLKTGLSRPIEVYTKLFDTPLKISKLNYLLYPYFGGVPKAPQDMNIYITDIKTK